MNLRTFKSISILVFTGLGFAAARAGNRVEADGLVQMESRQLDE